MSEADDMAYEAVLFASLFATADQKEGMNAFLKRGHRFSRHLNRSE